MASSKDKFKDKLLFANLLLTRLLLNCAFAPLFLCLAMLIAFTASAQAGEKQSNEKQSQSVEQEQEQEQEQNKLGKEAGKGGDKEVDKGGDKHNRAAIDERLQRLYRRVRCPVCAGQPISESDAPLSRILREELAKKIEAGESDEEALAWLVARYGEGVLLRPRFSSAALLWLAPLVFAGASLLLFRARTRRQG